MKQKFTSILGAVCLFTLSYTSFGQCPVPTCNIIAISGTNYTVNGGQTLCIQPGVNYNSGTITMNGGKIHIAAGGTMNSNRYVTATLGVVNASNASPIVINTAAAHGLSTGDKVYITGVNGNTAANSNQGSPNRGQFTITAISATSFSLDGSTGNGAYTSGGTIQMGGVFENCGTLNGTFMNAGNRYIGTIDNYANTTSIAMNLQFGTDLNNYGTSLSASFSSWNRPADIYNGTGASMTVTSSPTVYRGSTITNDGTITWATNLVMNQGVVLTNNSGATFNQTGGGPNFNGAVVDNYGDMNFTNAPTIQAGSGDSSTVNNYSGGNFNVTNGTLDITGGSYFNNEGDVDVQAVRSQNGSTIDLGPNSTFTSNSGNFDITGNSTWNINGGSLTMFNAQFQSTGTVNMYNSASITVTNQLSLMDNPINSTSSCSYIDLSGISDPGFKNQNIVDTNSGAASTANVCGHVPYSGTDQNNITNATNASPIRITQSTNNNNRVANGVTVYIRNVGGNTAANGAYVVANCDAGCLNFDLVGTTGSGAYTSGGTVHPVHKFGDGTYSGFSGCTNPCPPPTVLPIDLLSFTAVENGTVVDLDWTTISETDNDYFELQRSTNGTQWETFAIVPGAGTYSGLLQYHNVDSDPFPGVSYYRLKQVDYNGDFAHSHIEVVNFDNLSNWVLYPNPTDNGEVFIKSFSAIEDNYYVEVIDALGRTVESVFIKQGSDQYRNSIIDESADLATGMYTVRLSSSKERSALKLIIR